MISALNYQLIRYIINGLMATSVTYVVFYVCIHALHIPSAGISNFFAAVVGITASFYGSRHFVFSSTGESVWHQLTRFWVLYAVLALLQGMVLFLWTDVENLDYRVGFLIGTLLQMVCSYYGGKHWVFK